MNDNTDRERAERAEAGENTALRDMEIERNMLRSTLREVLARAEAAEAERDALRRAIEALAERAAAVIKAWDDFGTYEPCSECLRSGVALVDFDSDERMDKATDALRAVLASHPTGTPEGDASPAAVDTPLTRPTCMACGWQAPAGAEAPSTCPACAGAESW